MQKEVERRADKIFKEISSAKKEGIVLTYLRKSYNREKGYELWVKNYKRNTLIIQCDFGSTYMIKCSMVEIKIYSFDTVLSFIHIIMSQGGII